MTSVVSSAREDTLDELVPSVDGLYVYGVVQPVPGRVPDGLTGLDEAPVSLLGGGDNIAAAVARVALDRPPGRRAELVAHSRVLDALAATGPVIPIQFGSVMADAESVLEVLLAPHEEHFTGLLAELTGRDQFNVRASYQDQVALAEVVSADPEIARLRDLTRQLPDDAGHAHRVRLGELVAHALEDKREVDAAALAESILPFVVGSAPRSGAGIDHVLDMAFLVDQTRRAEFEEQLEHLAELVHDRIRLRLVGPVAPYDFVGEA